MNRSLKLTVILAAALLPLLVSCSDYNYRINGSIADYNGSAILSYTGLTGGGGSDTTAVKNGKFVFRGTTDDVYNARISVEPDGSAPVYTFIVLEDGDIDVVMYPETAVVQEGDAVSSCDADVRGARNNDFMNDLDAATAGTSGEKRIRAMHDCMLAHPDCEYAAFLYGCYFMNKPLDEFVAEFGSFTESVRNSAMTATIRRDLDYKMKTAPGVEALDFTLRDKNGGPVTLSSFRGKYVIVDFWASWCVPCRQGVPAMKELYAKYRDKGLEIIGVSQDKDRDSWLKAAEADGAGWTQVIDEYEEGESEPLVGSAYGVRSIPAYFLLDKEGRFIGKFDHDELEEQLLNLCR